LTTYSFQDKFDVSDTEAQHVDLESRIITNDKALQVLAAEATLPLRDQQGRLSSSSHLTRRIAMRRTMELQTDRLQQNTDNFGH
jgi:uncharacterized protein YaiI (UPF0178 family)